MGEKNNQISSQSNVVAESVIEFAKRMNAPGKSKMLTEHDTMRQKERHITFFMRNKNKNRYPHVVLFNEGAVILKTTKNDKPEDDYIHATKLKGRYGNYVLAQHKYFTVKTLVSRNEGTTTTFDLKITNKNDVEERMIHVLVFNRWEVVSRPPKSTELLSLVRATWALEKTSMLEEKCPTLVHGVSGTRRTGTYVLLSMLCKQMTERQQLSVIVACTTVRSYRYNVMRNRSCFIALLQALIIYAGDNGLVNSSKQSFKMALEHLRKVPQKGDENSDNL